MMRIALLALLVVIGNGCKGKSEEHPLQAAAKACAESGGLSCVLPIFNVDRLKASQSYYVDKLGFKIDWEHGDPPDFGSVSRDHSVLFMCQRCQGHPGAWVMIIAPDVDKLHAELVRNGAIIKMPPTDMPWGMREMHVADPDGNVMRFGHSLDHD